MAHAYRMAGNIEESTDRLALLVYHLCRIEIMVHRTSLLTTVSVDFGFTFCNLEREVLVRRLICDRFYCSGNDCLHCTLLISCICTTRLCADSTETRGTVGMDAMKKDVVVRKTRAFADLRTDFSSQRRRNLHHIV